MSNAKKKQYGKGGKSTGRKGINWPMAEIAYVYSHDLTYDGVAQMLGCSNTRVAQEARKRNWTAKRAATQEKIISAAAKLVEQQFTEGLQQAISKTVTTQIEMAEVISHYPAVVRTLIAEWAQAVKKAQADESGATPMPKAPFSPHAYKAICEAQRSLQGWERLRQGQPSDVQGMQVMEIGILNVLSDLDEDDGETE